MDVALKPLYRLSLPTFLIVALGVFLADQSSKFWAVTQLTDARPPASAASWATASGASLHAFWACQHPRARHLTTVHPNYFHFRYVENPGAAWGFLAGSASRLRTPFFLVLSLVAAGGLLWARRQPSESRLFILALPLIFGGAVGNFFDRVRLGYVIDFIDWHYFDRAAWPTFNVADAAITIGVLLMLPSQLRPPPRPREGDGVSHDPI